MTYSVGIRDAVINFYELYKNKSSNIIKEISYIFCICKSTFYNWYNQYVISGNVEIAKQGRPINTGKLNSDIEKYIIVTFTRNNKISPSVKNIKRSIKRIFGIIINKSSIYYVLKKNKITYKQVTIERNPYNKSKLNKCKKELRDKLINLETNKIDDTVISVDESFISPENIKKCKSWSHSGTRCTRKINGRRFKEGKSLLLAISNKKVIGNKLVKGTVNGEIFRRFILDDVLKGDRHKIILLDNARTHHYKEFVKDIINTSNKLVYNIPYHPQTNPIEYINNVIKNNLKKKGINNINDVDKYLQKAISRIPENVFNNCFQKALENMHS